LVPGALAEGGVPGAPAAEGAAPAAALAESSVFAEVVETIEGSAAPAASAGRAGPGVVPLLASRAACQASSTIHRAAAYGAACSVSALICRNLLGNEELESRTDVG
jgi:hypothetical protein